MTKKDTMCAFAVLLLFALPHAQAGELYAQAIGQPPERPPAPAEPPAQAPPPEPAEPKVAEEEAEEEEQVAAAPQREELRTRILIGAGLALALGALAGGGGGNGGGPPAGGETVPNHQ